MGVGEGDDRDGREKDGKRDRSVRKKERKRDRDGRAKDGETGAEREIGRETGVGESESVRDRGEKIANTKKFMEFYLVVLQSDYQRQGGKEKDRKRDGLGERERKI